jgi:bacillithiol biosynthesis deacetylase BshB1
MEPVDLLVFGPHPDDIEIGLGGTVAKHAALGCRVGLCDLTAGEMGSNGTVPERLAEADAARAALGASWRVNLRWTDRGIDRVEDRGRGAVDLIRQVRPRTVALPYWADRHPDHVAASKVLSEAVFDSGLRRLDASGDAWRPEWVCFYFINDSTTPSFVVNVSEHYETKRRALACHRTQFSQLIESRDAHFGALVGVRFAEGLIVREPIVRDTLFKRDTWNREP